MLADAFTGDYLRWPTFRDLFAAIYINKTVSPERKNKWRCTEHSFPYQRWFSFSMEEEELVRWIRSRLGGATERFAGCG